MCDKCFQIANLCWSLRSVFGYAAAGAWVYRGAVVIFNGEEEDLVVVDTPRAPAEAPRPLLLQ